MLEKVRRSTPDRQTFRKGNCFCVLCIISELRSELCGVMTPKYSQMNNITILFISVQPVQSSTVTPEFFPSSEVVCWLSDLVLGGPLNILSRPEAPHLPPVVSHPLESSAAAEGEGVSVHVHVCSLFLVTRAHSHMTKVCQSFEELVWMCRKQLRFFRSNGSWTFINKMAAQNKDPHQEVGLGHGPHKD